MCVVSMVYDWADTLPNKYWTHHNYVYLGELIKKAEKYDELTKQPHCEDPEKAKVLERIEQRLKELEEKEAIRAWNAAKKKKL